MPPKSQTRYQKAWEREFSWVQPHSKNPFKAWCKICSVEFNVESMGRTAVVSHANGKKHVGLAKAAASTTLQYFLPVQSTSSAALSHTPGSSASISQPISSKEPNLQPSDKGSAEASYPSHSRTTENLDKYRMKDNTTKAETLWCLHNVMCHLSLRTSATAVTLFPSMFPDSDIAKSMSLQKDKVSYCVTYGLSPYLQRLLEESLKSVDFVVVGFDESMNSVAQKQQMDVTVRFWDSKVSSVTSRYLTSVFMNSCTAENLLSGLEKAMRPETSPGVLNKILQFSMDGPNVNFKLLRLFNETYRSELDAPKLLELGSCGLHVVNGAFRTGLLKTGWNIDNFLKSAYFLFHESPARRGHFMKLTESDSFPLKFCSIRWTENSIVSGRALKLLTPLKKYVDAVKGTEKEPACKSFKIVGEALKDKMLPAKLAFFTSLSEDVEPFLREFQADAPMAPFLYEALHSLLKNSMARFVKDDVLENNPLQKIDVLKTSGESNTAFVNLMSAKNIDLGYATRNALKNCCQGVSEKDLLVFRQNCRTCLQNFVAKLLQRSPLKYPLTKALTFLNPNAIVSNPKEAVSNMSKALELLSEANILPTSEVQKADREYRELVEKKSVLDRLKVYEREKERLDSLWMGVLSEYSGLTSLGKVVRILLCLSHGNAGLERGFSINSEILVENLQEDSLIAQRRVYDFVSCAGGITAIEISKPLILSMRSAYSRYKDALEEKRKEVAAKKKAAEEKKRAAILVDELRQKRRKIQQDAEKQLSQIDNKIDDLKKGLSG